MRKHFFFIKVRQGHWNHPEIKDFPTLLRYYMFLGEINLQKRNDVSIFTPKPLFVVILRTFTFIPSSHVPPCDIGGCNIILPRQSANMMKYGDPMKSLSAEWTQHPGGELSVALWWVFSDQIGFDLMHKNVFCCCCCFYLFYFNFFLMLQYKHIIFTVFTAIGDGA